VTLVAGDGAYGLLRVTGVLVGLLADGGPPGSHLQRGPGAALQLRVYSAGARTIAANELAPKSEAAGSSRSPSTSFRCCRSPGRTGRRRPCPSRCPCRRGRVCWTSSSFPSTAARSRSPRGGCRALSSSSPGPITAARRPSGASGSPRSASTSSRIASSSRPSVCTSCSLRCGVGLVVGLGHRRVLAVLEVDLDRAGGGPDAGAPGRDADADRDGAGRAGGADPGGRAR
jgi:hypothetical protein